jgi:surfactin synthase thioesterase subunit/glycosyltransferase involved in cell wall biosynthesis
VRILLAHNSLYYPSHGGGDKSNRLLMEALAARGHQIRVVSRVEKFGVEAHDKLLSDLASRAVSVVTSDNSVRFSLHGADVFTLTLEPNLRAYFSAHLAAFDPEIIITSTDDPGQLLFDLAVRAPRARVVHLVRATIAVPFGPDSSSPNREKTEILRGAGAIVGVSEYVAAYIRQWGNMDAVHVPISLMDSGMPGNLGSFDSPFVTMVNPCAVKGIDIFVALAARMPDLQFAAVPTWGTNAQDLAALRSRTNITLLEPVDNIDDLLLRTRVVLVPSLWAEARSRFVVEAMLRGVPVIASDAGGIREAKLGVPYLIPVNLITHYKAALDENLVPVAETPPQDIDPWAETLVRLTGDRAHWRQLALQSREAAMRYLETLSVEPFERLLLDVLKRPRLALPAAPVSDSRKRLAAVLLKHRHAPRWFPALNPANGQLRLFCFPHAGGGTRAYRGWSIDGVEVCPVLLPGRESRGSEPPIDNMPDTVAALESAILPYIHEPYAFFGHSMGAGIAFELARRLENPPRVLIVSAARGPQYRIDRQPGPDPSDEELLSQLSSLGSDRDLLEIFLPLLRADTRLYRNYRFVPGPLLAVPIAAYGGESDPEVSRGALAEWKELTLGEFVQREFPGGHFYLQSDPGAVLRAIAEDLKRLGLPSVG